MNPVAGGGRGQALQTQIVAELDKKFPQGYELALTSEPGSAIQLAREAAKQGARLLIAMGGDGTINEVVNGLFDHQKPLNPYCELGILNCGSGGGLAQTLGLPAGIADQLELICRAPAKPLDVGIVRFQNSNGEPAERLFVSECQGGIGGAVVSRVGMKHKRLGGTLAFGMVAISELLHYRATQMTTRVDGRVPQAKYRIGFTVGNGRFCAGGMQLTPGALPDDNWLDILQIDEMNLLNRLVNFSKVYSGRHIRSPFFTLQQAKTIEIDSDPPVWFETDGELIGKTPCRIGILPAAIRVRY